MGASVNAGAVGSARLVQFLESANERDAVGNFVLAVDDAARDRGFDTAIYANTFDAALADRVGFYGDYPGVARANDVCVYHGATYSPLVPFLKSRTERLVVYYHNVTPPKYFAPYKPDFVPVLGSAIEQIRGLATHADRGVAASRFSAGDLVRWGYPDVRVAPIIVDPDLYGPDRTSTTGAGSHTTFVVVGRVAPHKGIHKAVRAFAILREARPEFELVVVGALHTSSYGWALGRYVEHLALDNVELAGSVPQGRLLDEFAAATALISMSDHEGFGVPLLEAMGRDVPVIALDTSAVAETCGGAVLLLPDDSPELLAAACERVADDNALRAEMIERGRRRWEEATGPDVTEAVLDALVSR